MVGVAAAGAAGGLRAAAAAAAAGRRAVGAARAAATAARDRTGRRGAATAAATRDHHACLEPAARRRGASTRAKIGCATPAAAVETIATGASGAAAVPAACWSTCAAHVHLQDIPGRNREGRGCLAAKASASPGSLSLRSEYVHLHRADGVRDREALRRAGEGVHACRRSGRSPCSPAADPPPTRSRRAAATTPARAPPSTLVPTAFWRRRRSFDVPGRESSAACLAPSVDPSNRPTPPTSHNRRWESMAWPAL